MVLSECKKGDVLEVIDIEDDWAREQVIRFGIVKGIKVVCESIISKGPVVIRRGNQNIAIGHQIAAKIQVKRRWR